jgi:integrase/recombinase XerD
MEVTRLIEQFLRHTALERGRSANTIVAYRRDLDRWAAFVGTRAIESIDSVAVTDYLTSLRRDGLATSSITRALSVVRSFHRYLVTEGLVSSDPTGAVIAPGRPQRLPKALSIEQVTALLESTPTETPVGLRDRAILELMYATGARVSEAVGLTVDDVRADEVLEVITLTGKGNKQRVVPVGRFAREALDAYLVRGRPALLANGRGTPALFLGARGAPLSRQNVFLIIRAAAARADITSTISPHTLRHSCATHLLRGGADIRVVQEMLGHASVATTQIYTLVTRDALTEAYRTSHPRAR